MSNCQTDKIISKPEFQHFNFKYIFCAVGITANQNVHALTQKPNNNLPIISIQFNIGSKTLHFLTIYMPSARKKYT